MEKFVYNDGGRAEAGFKGTTGDCVTRAIAIATQLPYKQVYDEINKLGKTEKTGKRKRGISNARTGVYKATIRKYMESLGWKWVPTMFVGQGCKVHLCAEELPKGRLVVNVSRHSTAVIDGVINDIYNPNREGSYVRYEGDEVVYGAIPNRCVYGYFYKPDVNIHNS